MMEISAQDKKDIIEFANLLLKKYISFINKWDMEQCKTIYKSNGKGE